MRSREAVLLLALIAPSAHAQLREFEARLDSLARIASSTQAAVRRHDDSLRQSSGLFDTARAAAPTIVVERALISVARSVAPVVLDSLRAEFGDATSRLTGYAVRLHLEPRASGWSNRDSSPELILAVARPGGAPLRMWRSPPDSLSIGASLHHALSFAMFDAADPAFFAWASYTIPRDTPRVSGWAQQRLALVSSGTAVGQRCYRGDLAACRIALLLAPEADPVLTWHDSVTRRRLVRRHGALARRLDPKEERQCLAGSDAACIAVLQQFPPSAFREPGASALRVGFLRHALAVGGTGAIERLLGAHTAPARRLEAAARQPLDSVIGSWQARVKHTRAPSEDLTIGITMVSLLWTTGIGALALRSSRWR